LGAGLTTGRRAADRRRQREGGDAPGVDDADDAAGTTPGALPASPHDDYVEVDDEASRLDASLIASADVVDLQDDSAMARATTSPRKAQRPAPRPDGDDAADVEKNFARELKRRPREETAAQARLEVTEVKERKARKPRRGGRLVVVAVDGAPPASPVELPIAVYPALLGRAHDADVHVDDPTVSLRHAELSWRAPNDTADDDGDDVGFSIADLGSTSGTLVNGIAIDGRTTLVHGDIIGVGKTELRLLRAEAVPEARVVQAPVVEAPAEPAPPERTSTQLRVARQAAAEAQREAQREAHRRAEEAAAALRRRVRRRATWVIAACAALGVVVVGSRFVHGQLLSDAAPAQVRMHVATLLGEARERLLKGDVDGASARVDALLALAPDDEEGQSLARVVRTETAARDALQLALRLGDEDRDDEALDALARIADSSVFFRDRERLRTTLAERALVRSLRVVEALLEQGRVDDALARVQEHLKRFPDDKAGQALLLRVQAAKENAPKDPGLQPARAAFSAGRLDDARRLATTAGYAGYARDVDRFERSVNEGKAALTRYDGATARAPLDEAFRLLGSLGAGPTSAIFASVQKPYADALYLSGTEKLEAGDGCGAARDLLKAGRVLPDDPRILAAQDRLATRADQALTLARGARPEDPERARSIARQALCFARSGTKIWDELNTLSR
jgi:tetratricopeptide (TPR) repeat protein